MDLIPLDPTLVRGTHGIRPQDPLDWPIIFGHSVHPSTEPLPATKVHGSLLNALKFGKG